MGHDAEFPLIDRERVVALGVATCLKREHPDVHTIDWIDIDPIADLVRPDTARADTSKRPCGPGGPFRRPTLEPSGGLDLDQRPVAGSSIVGSPLDSPQRIIANGLRHDVLDEVAPSCIHAKVTKSPAPEVQDGPDAQGLRPAVAAQHAIDQLGVRRVFILDWDVHHGNGTAEIFRRRDDVLYASIHQANICPGSGPLRDAGSGTGLGYTINLPVPAGSDGERWVSLLEHVVLPAATAFRPELVLISAGFDAHRADPLGGCQLESSDFARMTRHVRDLAQLTDAPIGAVLEGGYDPPALAESVIATMRALGEHDPAESIAPDLIYTRQAASYIGHHWEL